MDPTTLNSLQLDQLRQGLTAVGLLQANSTDQQVQNAFLQYNATNPSGAATLWSQAGLPGAIPWLPIIGGIVGVIAIYFIWSQNRGATQVDAYEYPEQHDNKHRLMSMSKSLRPMGGRSMKGCKPLGRLGAAAHKKYEFEPEIRLEGLHRKRARR